MEEKDKDWQKKIESILNDPRNMKMVRFRAWFNSKSLLKQAVFCIAVVLGFAVLITIIGTLFAALFYWRFPDINSLLEFFGAVLTLVGTVILGAVTVWQTKKANDIAEESLKLSERADEYARMVHELEHKPNVTIETRYYDDIWMNWELRSASIHVLRLRNTEREEMGLSTREDLYYNEGELYNAGPEIRDKLKDEPLRKDLLFFEFHNNSNDPVTIRIGQVRQYYPAEDGTYKEFKDFKQTDFPVEEIPGKGCVKLVIRDAGRTQEKPEIPKKSGNRKKAEQTEPGEENVFNPFDHVWKLVLPISVTNDWKDKTIEKAWEIKYVIRKVEGMWKKQEYIISGYAPWTLPKEDVNTGKQQNDAPPCEADA